MKNKKITKENSDVSDARIQEYIKQVQNESDKKMERYVGMVTEDFNDKLKFVTEHILSTENGIEEIKSDLTVIKSLLHLPV